MFKVLVLSTLLLSASNVFAESSTVAKLEPVYKRITANTDTSFYSNHTYAVSNNSVFTKSVSVCFEIITCPEFPVYLRNVRDCRSFDLKPWETKLDSKSLHLTVNYPFMGWCHIQAITETTGETTSRAKDETVFEVRQLR